MTEGQYVSLSVLLHTEVLQFLQFKGNTRLKKSERLNDEDFCVKLKQQLKPLSLEVLNPVLPALQQLEEPVTGIIPSLHPYPVSGHGLNRQPSAEDTGARCHQNLLI